MVERNQTLGFRMDWKGMKEEILRMEVKKRRFEKRASTRSKDVVIGWSPFLGEIYEHFH